MLAPVLNERPGNRDPFGSPGHEPPGPRVHETSGNLSDVPGVASWQIEADSPPAPGVISGPCDEFLKRRTGWMWTDIVRDWALLTGQPNPFRGTTPEGLASLVAQGVESVGGELLFHGGWFAGRPLRAGWRQRWFVCPVSGRLLAIPVADSDESAF